MDEKIKTKKIKILIVDSDEMMRICFRDIFWIHGRSHQYDITMTATFDEAEKIVLNENTRPDTILVDIIMLPKKRVSSSEILDCVGFVSKIKNNKELSSIKVILYSGQKEKTLKENLSKIGIDGFLVKGESTPKEIINYIDNIHGAGLNN